MKKLSVLLLAATLVWVLFFRESSVSYGPGVVAPEEPQQERIKKPQPFRHKGWKVTPLATFHITAKILSRRDYSRGIGSDIIPTDLVLGWGRMSDDSILQSIHISQRNRWYHWWVKKFPIPRRELERHSANMHLIPADEVVAAELKRARKGEVIELRGKLVRLDDNNGYWVSSLTRRDTGNNACELIWVEEFAQVE